MADKRDWQYELEEYIRQGEPGKTERSYAWRTEGCPGGDYP